MPDIQLHYEWREGSLPPPHHYEYRLEVHGDQGRIEFSPDYPAEDKPLWVEPFLVDPNIVESIVDKLRTEGLLRPEPAAEEDRSPAGDSIEWVELERDGEQYSIPPDVVRENERAKEIVVEVRSLVPEPLWDELMRRRRDYERTWKPS